MDTFRFAGPLIRLLEPERAHNLTLWCLKTGVVPSQKPVISPLLKTSLWGREFSNPLGLAAGFDKNAEVVQPMLDQGFGFVEVGSITPRAQPGNPRPRIFRLAEDQAVINRMGFNNGGAEAACERLQKLKSEGYKGLLGVNLGKNKDTAVAVDDYKKGAQLLAPYADYMVINVSSPNTPGLRALQGRAELQVLIGGVQETLRQNLGDKAPPLVLKIAPDLTEADKEDIASVALELKLDGLTVTNTTIDRPDSLQSVHRNEAGGLSGAPLFEASTKVLGDIYRLTEGKIPLIGVGGISSGVQAYAKIRAGASLVQLYSALVYGGPALIPLVLTELVQLLTRDGFSSVTEAVGADHR
ncbi:quinone-dependent dihydroorotate dehydrogenase [Kiloniella laminariae]|uniref:Dihydroorotate dehydrogenase (quinone) n=1 Tax=Kiloniella laminariae TaxID=454162 RepID=A0ABT4LMA6_9PROT|nr:quinone-dependent dihydroorotate dehydrogenase [Kiloniella laminariae]MCZ4282209.1 quinone-dependent dihydroorotate dehydrogenase [Kiloniella laminariae]